MNKEELDNNEPESRLIFPEPGSPEDKSGLIFSYLGMEFRVISDTAVNPDDQTGGIAEEPKL